MPCFFFYSAQDDGPQLKGKWAIHIHVPRKKHKLSGRVQIYV